MIAGKAADQVLRGSKQKRSAGQPYCWKYADPSHSLNTHPLLHCTHTRCIKFCNDAKLLEKFRESAKLLDMVQKGLSDYLETKRAGFSRFYFLSNDELLEILSQTKVGRY